MAVTLSIGPETYQTSTNTSMDRFRILVKNSGDASAVEFRAWLTNIKVSSGGPSLPAFRVPRPLSLVHVPDFLIGRLQPGHPGILIDVLEKVAGSATRHRVLSPLEQPEVITAVGYEYHIAVTANGVAPVTAVYTDQLISNFHRFIRTS